MATNTTNLHLIKPAGSERVQISQINQNMDILDEKIGAVGNTSLQGQITAANSSISSLNSQKGSKSTISSDTEILGYAPGTYMIALSAASDYLPERWGTLVIEKSGATYGVATFKSTGGNVYVRHMNGANSWHNSWTQLALNSQIVKLSNITENIKSYGGGGTDIDNTSFLLGELSISNKSGLLFYYASGTANLTANDVMVFRLYDGDTLLGGFGSTNLQGKQWISTSGHYKLTATNHTMKLVLTTFGGATIKVPAYNSIVGRLMFIPLPA